MMIIRHKVRDYGQWRPSFDGLNSGLAQSVSRSYPNNDLVDLSVSGVSTYRVALTDTRSADGPARGDPH
jgi:hypothetical protein